ncbi:CPBP family intramembrane glutamic endopeptidase [Dermatophilus congolensis]|nr:CPBP family intramembrane glutamic endopeptidase [Dermatophilus congolensis]
MATVSIFFNHHSNHHYKLCRSYLFSLLLALISGGPEGLQRQLKTWEPGSNEITFFSMISFDLVLAALIPCVLISVRFGNKGCAALVHSVAGRFRWRWALRCVVTLLPVWVVYIGVEQFLTAPEGSHPEPNLLGIIFIAIFITPLQAAGEEYFFRGWMMQNVGSWFKDPRVALFIAGAVSTVTFAVAHGATDFWILVDLGGTAIACVYLTWRTGGLEAAVALHTVNNMIVGIGSGLAGTASASVVTESTTGSFVGTLVSVAMNVLAVVILLRLTRSTDVANRAHEPYATPAIP